MLHSMQIAPLSRASGAGSVDTSVVGQEMLLLIPTHMLVSGVLLLLTRCYLKKFIGRIGPEIENSNFTHLENPIPWLSWGRYSLGVSAMCLLPEEGPILFLSFFPGRRQRRANGGRLKGGRFQLMLKNIL